VGQLRDRLNNDPKVQAAVLGVAGILLAFFLFTKVLAGGDTATTSTTPDATTPGVTAPATGTDSAASTGAASSPTGSTATATPSTPSTDAGTSATGATGTVTPPATGATTPPAGAATSGAMLPTKGLPSDVLVAYAKNKVILLLVTDPKSPGSKRLERYADDLKLKKNVEVFKATPKDIPKYSRIAAGVDVSQTPAIVVIKPRKLVDNVPTATVSYGMRNKRSFEQTVYDALYKGGQVPAYP
jgi:hypothetical protein